MQVIISNEILYSWTTQMLRFAPNRAEPNLPQSRSSELDHD